MNIEVTSFSLGVIVAAVTIVLVALVVIVLKLRKTDKDQADQLRNVWQEFNEVANNLAKCRDDLLNCDLPVLEKKCNSYTDSRVDKLVESKKVK